MEEKLQREKSIPFVNDKNESRIVYFKIKRKEILKAYEYSYM